MTYYDLRNYKSGSVIPFYYPCGDDKTNCHPISVALPIGIYKFDVYGAEGGRAFNKSGGFGGFSTGKLSIYKPVRAYLFIGAHGPSTASEFSAKSSNAYNGGGSGFQSPNTYYMASSGGGASDVRLFSSDIYHRLIVAGGGGGSGNYSEYLKGGNGGGEKGETGSRKPVPQSFYYGGYGANQTSGNLLYGDNATSFDGCGGGGGLYGGGYGYGYNNPGGGGSGFVFNGSTTSIASAAGISLSPQYFLFDSYTSMSDHLGDGFISITIISINIGEYSCRTNSLRTEMISTLIVFLTS
jgi:hypothetical protein